jgi:hypothetical protein
VSLVSGVRVVGDPWVEIEAVCEVHGGSGRLVIRRDGERIVLDAHADECCVITVEGAGMTLCLMCSGSGSGERDSTEAAGGRGRAARHATRLLDGLPVHVCHSAEQAATVTVTTGTSEARQ